MIDKIKDLLGIKTLDKKIERVLELDFFLKSHSDSLNSSANTYTSAYKGLSYLQQSKEIVDPDILKSAEESFMNFQKGHIEEVSGLRSEIADMEKEKEKLLSEKKINDAYKNYEIIHKSINLSVESEPESDLRESVKEIIKACKNRELSQDTLYKALCKAKEIEVEKVSKSEAGYSSDASNTSTQCQFCENYESEKCSKVLGKISNTGSCSKFSAAEIVAEKSEKSEIEKSEPEAYENENQKPEGKKEGIAEYAKKASETELGEAIKKSKEPEVREAAHQELDRREKEEKQKDGKVPEGKGEKVAR